MPRILEVLTPEAAPAQQGADPFLVTLPVASLGDRSRNTYPDAEGNEVHPVWTEAALANLQTEINRRKPDMNFGHAGGLFDGYKVPVGRWTGAERHGDTLYAKAELLPSAQREREFLELSQRTGAPVGTSIYGTIPDDDTGFERLTLEALDVLHPERLGNPNAAGVPRITSEGRRIGAGLPSWIANMDVSREAMERDAKLVLGVEVKRGDRI